MLVLSVQTEVIILLTNNDGIFLRNIQHLCTWSPRCSNKLCGRPPQYAPALYKLTLESRVRVLWATSMPLVVFLGLSVLDLGPMYSTDVRCASSLNAPYPRGGA